MEIKTLEKFQPLSRKQISKIYGGDTTTCVTYSEAGSNSSMSWSSDTSRVTSDNQTGRIISSSMSYTNKIICQE
jgi:hypothetical protein